MSDDEASKRTPPADPQPEEAEILLVEDNPGDVRLLQEALAVTDIPHQLHVVTNGDEGIEFVYRRGEYADAPQPDLILLDLNLPQTDGHEVLTEVKSNPERSQIPIIVLSSSNDEGDVQRAYAAGANAYLTKPVDPDELVERVELIQTFWFSFAQLPD